MNHQFRQITPTDHFGWHAAYLPVYGRLFAPLKKTAQMVLEIGTDGGGGLLMYADYFRNARIFGMDIAPAPQGLIYEERIVHLQRDAYTSESVAQFDTKRFDVAIDDGPHTLSSQEFFVANYPHLLTENGIAIVEDIQEVAHIEALARCVPAGFFSFAIDLRHVEPARYDNLLFVVQR